MHVSHGKLAAMKDDLKDISIDLFITSASFESRCLSIANSLDASAIGVTIVAQNFEYADAIANNYKVLSSFLSISKKLELYINDPLKSADSLYNSIYPELTGNKKNLLVDITTFTRESLLMLTGFLRNHIRADDRIFFAYAHAKEYSVGDPTEKKWLSKGLREVRTVLGYPGSLSPSKKSHLIILVGFEDERAVELIRECEPSIVSLGIEDSREEGTIPHHEANLHFSQRIKHLVGQVYSFEFKAYNAEETKSALRQQAGLHAGCNVMVAPMNTKISTLGAAMFAMEDERVQLCYAPANTYNTSRYSQPGEDYYLFELPGFNTK